MRTAARLGTLACLGFASAALPAAPGPAPSALAPHLSSPQLPNEAVVGHGRVVPGEGELAGFHIEIDPVTGRPARAFGGRLPWLPGRGNRLAGAPPRGGERRARLFAAAEAFLTRHGALWNLPPGAAVRDEDGTVSVEAEELDVVRLALLEDGLTVLGGRLTFVLRHGNLVWFGSSHASAPGEAGLAPAPAGPFPGERAVAGLAAALGLEPADLAPRPARRERFVLPGVSGGRPVRRRIAARRFRPAGEPADLEAWFDEADGSLVALFPAEIGCSSPQTGITGRVVGGIRPARGDDPEQLRALPHADLGGGRYAGRGGEYPWSGAAVTSTLDGRYATVNCLACTNPVQARATSGPDGGIDFGFNAAGQADSLGNGTSTLASRTAYAHVTTARELAAKWLGGALGFLDQALEVQVNGQNACNALWSGFALRFFESSADCRNTGEIRDVVAHEWGHALDDFDGTGISDLALSEGAADLLATLLDRNSCIADSLWTDPGLGASSRCRGVRDVDEFAPGLDHSPATLTWSRNDCLGGAHCLGEIYGQTNWHLVRDLELGRSYGDGRPLGRALGEELAWEVAERLFLLSRPLAETLNPAAAGLSLYDAYVLADEDPWGNHPHAAAINDAFAHHELIEPSPVAEGLECPPPADPPPLAADLSRGADGEVQASLWWRDVAADRYLVTRRRRGAESAWLPVRPAIADDDRPQYGIVDGPLDNGESYEYRVLAEATPGCWGAGATRVNFDPAFPELAVAVVRTSDPAPGGDGDGIVEPGEFFALETDLHETLGLADATGVLATIASLDPLVRVGTASSVPFGAVARLAFVPAPAPFTLWIDPLHACPARIPLVLSIDSDQGCLERALEVPIEAGACPAGQRSDVRYRTARVTRDDLDPACTDGDRLLDAGERARISVEVENVGPAAASLVEVILTSAEPRITFLSGTRAELAAGLLPGESGFAEFEVLAGDLACATPVEMLAEVRAPENLQPATGSFSLSAEQDVTASALSWDFESGAQGWSGGGMWGLSRARSNPDDRGQSFWSGAAFNLCDDLVSPEFQLDSAAPLTLTLATWYELEGRFQAKYWDGVNVHLLTEAGDVRLVPSAGRGYDASLGKLVLCETNQPAWVSDTAGQSWATSSFDLSPWAGQTVRIAVRMSTDNKTTLEGFYLDDVSVSRVSLSACDVTTCAPDPSCSAPEMYLVAPAGGCALEPVTLEARFDYFGSGAFTYTWDFGDGVQQATLVPDAPVTHVYDRSGIFAARLTATRTLDPGCSTSALAVLAIGAAPIADAGADVVAPARIGTPGFAGSEYRWTPADGLDDPAVPEPWAAPAVSTEYCLTVRELASGCERADCVVAAVPPPCGVDPDAVGDLRLARRSADVAASWSAVAGAGRYDFYRVSEKDRIPGALAENTGADRVASGAGTAAVDPGAVAVPPSLAFYQAVARCP